MQQSGTLAASAEGLHSGPNTHMAADNSSSSPGLCGHWAHMVHTHEGIRTYTENKSEQILRAFTRKARDRVFVTLGQT